MKEAMRCEAMDTDYQYEMKWHSFRDILKEREANGGRNS